MKFSFATATVAAAMFAVPGVSQAAIVINIVESGSNVVATGSGSFNTAGLTTSSTFDNLAGVIRPTLAIIRVGAGSERLYNVVSGPGSFGTSSTQLNATSSSGDIFGVNGFTGVMFLPINYVSGSALSGQSIFAGQSFASLGLSTGSYVYQSGADTITVNIGAVTNPVPEPATWLTMILGFGAIGCAMRYRARKSHIAFA